VPSRPVHRAAPPAAAAARRAGGAILHAALSRRAVLQAAAAALLARTAGCSLLAPQASLPQPPPTSIFLDDGASPAVASAFAAFDPAVVPIVARQTAPLRRSGKMPPWAVQWAYTNPPEIVPASPHPLNLALRLLNFDPASLVPGALEAFSAAGQVNAMPISAEPYGLLYQPAVFAAAGVAPPTPDWTFEDLAGACAAIQLVVPQLAGLGIYGPLPPLVGQASIPVVFRNGGRSEHFEFQVEGTLNDGLLIQAFAAGYGGWLAQGGSYDFTNSGAVRGLTALANLARQYGAPAGDLPHSLSAQNSFRNGAAMDFGLYAQGAGSRWRVSRLPRLPLLPVVPAQLTGIRLAWETSTGRISTTGTHEAPDQAVMALVQYALWQYGQVRATPAGNLPAPVLADAALQAAYWSAPLRKNSGGPGTADWPHYLFLYQGWPPVPKLDPIGMLYAAVSQAASGGDLVSALTAAEGTLNRATTNNAALGAAVAAARPGA